MLLCMYENTYVRIPKNIHTKLTGILYFCRTTILAARTLIKHLSALQQNGKQLDYCLCIVMLKATNIYTNNPHLRRPPDCYPPHTTIQPLLSSSSASAPVIALYSNCKASAQILEAG